MVNAMAPNAPIGAAHTMIWMIEKRTFVAFSKAWATVAPNDPSREQAKPGEDGDEKHLQQITGDERADQRVGDDVEDMVDE